MTRTEYEKLIKTAKEHKTYLVKTLARLLDVPLAIADATP